MFFLKRNISLLALVAGNGSLFIASLILKKLLPPAEYGEVAVMLTLITLLYSFGLLGGEQVFLRMSKLSASKEVSISISVVYINLLFFILNIVVVALYYVHEYNLAEWYKLLVVITSSIMAMFTYNFLRLTSSFFLAQIFSAFWKIALLISIFNIYFWHDNFSSKIVIDYIYYSSSLIILLVSFVFLLILKKIKLTQTQGIKEEIKYFSSFFFSMGVLTFLGLADRFVVEKQFGLEVFGQYYFISQVFMYPLLILGTYFGFKELPAFKENASLSLLKSKLRLALIVSLFVTICYILFLILVSCWIDIYSFVNIDFYDFKIMIIIFIITGCIRVIYSVLSSLLGARGTPEIINRANVVTLLLMILFVGIIFAFNVDVQGVAFVFLILWSCRCYIYYKGCTELLIENN